jgi:hypothetical protein
MQDSSLKPILQTTHSTRRSGMLRLLSGTSSWVSDAWNRCSRENHGGWQYADNTVVGQDELDSQSVNIRNRDDEVQGREETVKVDEAVARLIKMKEDKVGVTGKAL